ncbi:MAG: hypothetical protein AABY07_08720 [Nanoarchaeota archaeon]
MKCPDCDENLRGKYQSKDHYQRFHQPPTLNKDGTIQINAVHQVTLILKGDETWKQVIAEESNQSRKFKRVDESAYRSIQQLMQFEKENNIEFHHCDKDTFFIERAQQTFQKVDEK